MSPTDPSLDQVQRWMQAVIVHPDGVEAGMASKTARAEISLVPECVEDLIDRSQNLTSIERLQVYSNAYYARLLECLREEFPALVHALGSETFDGFGFGYLQAYPSHSYTLAELARHFPQFLAETRLDDDEAVPSDDTPDWPDFLIDLATVERTYSEVFSGPGVEGQQTLQPEDIAAITPDDFPNARLIPVLCLRLLRLHYPVHEYITAVRKRENPSVPEPKPTGLVITRREYVVRRCTASPLEFDLLDALQSGQTIGTAIESIFGQSASAWETLEANLHEWFRHWAAAGFFRAIESAD